MIRKIDEPAYQQGFTDAVNGGKLRELAAAIDFDEEGPAEQLGSGASKLIGFLDGLLQRIAPPKT